MSPDRGGKGGASLPASHFGQQDALSAGDASHCFLSRKRGLPGVLGLKDVGVTLSLCTVLARHWIAALNRDAIR